MILRLWSGWTTPEQADRYEELLNQTIAPAIVDRQIEGLLEFDVWRREPTEAAGPAAEVEFLTSMLFRDADAVAEFTGGDPSDSVVPPAARELLHHFEERSRHYRHQHKHLGARRPTTWLLPLLCFLAAAGFIASSALTAGAVCLGLGAVALALPHR